MDPRVVKVMDLKTPGSDEEARNLYENIKWLLPHDQVKFVICDRNDYEWAVSKLQEYDLGTSCQILFSPCYGQQDPTELAEWLLADRLPVRLQLQLHKLLWGEQPGH